MKTRILSGLIMAPLLVLLYFGGYPLMIAAFFIGIVGLYEFYKGFTAVGARPNYVVGAVATFALYAIYIFHLDEKFWLLWLTLLVAAGFVSCLYDFEDRTLYDGIATVTGVIYVVYFSFHVVLIEEDSGRFGRRRHRSCRTVRSVRVFLCETLSYGCAHNRMFRFCHFSVRRSYRQLIQKKDGDQGLWKPDTRTRRDPGQIRQRTVYGAFRLLLYFILCECRIMII